MYRSPRFYIYPTDGPGALNPGYERAQKYKRRQENLFYNVIDRVKNEQWFPDNAQAMAKMYPRAAGIRCDASAIRKMEVGDDPRLFPFGTLPYGWSPMLDTNTYESPGMSAGFDPEPPARLRSEVNSELNFPSNFEGLVLGCIDADFCK